MPKRLLKLLRFAALVSAIALFVSYIAPAVRPGTIPYLPLFGLVYPYLLVVNVLFLLLWIVRKSAWLLMQGAVILFGLSYMTDVVTISGPAEERTEDSIRLMSYNVRLFGYYQWKEQIQIRDRIFDRLKAEEADIHCFQEFYHSPPGKFQTRSELLKFSNSPYIHEKYTHEFVHDQYFGVVTMSQHPIVHKGYIPFDNGYQNFCIYSDIRLPSADTIRVFNAHLASIHFKKEEYDLINGEESSWKSRARQVVSMVEKLDTAYYKRASQIEKVLMEVERSPYPVLLAGDLNDTPISYCYSQIEKRLEDTFKDKGMGLGTTYNGHIPALRIDHVFRSEDFETLDYRIEQDDNSDHFPLIVDLVLLDKDTEN